MKDVIYRGHTIRRTVDGNYYVVGLEGPPAVNLGTAKKWIDQALASGELKRK